MQKQSLFMGIDIGTSVIKGTIIDADCEIIVQRSASMVDVFHSTEGYDHDPDAVWWAKFVELARSLTQDVQALNSNIACLAVTGMMPNITPIDASGKPVHNALLFYDSRAYQIERELDNALGTPRWQNEVLSKLLWLKEQIGETWDQIDAILSTHNYIVFKLTGQRSMDIVTAIECGNIYIPKEGRWNDDILAPFGITSSILPRVVAPNTIVGRIAEEPAMLIGLNAGIPVIAGTADTISTLIGAGLRKKNEMLVYYGTFNCAALLMEDLDNVISGAITANPLKWAASIPRSGQQLAMLAQQLFPAATTAESLEQLDRSAAESAPGANGLVFVQTMNFPKSTVSTEPRGAFVNLGVHNTKADLSRALLESFGYGLRYSFEVLGPAPHPSAYFAAGGGARSDIWKHIVSDILGVEQKHLPAADRGFGSALLAAAAVEPSLLELCRDRMLDQATLVRPVTADRTAYETSYQQYKTFLDRYNS